MNKPAASNAEKRQFVNVFGKRQLLQVAVVASLVVGTGTWLAVKREAQLKLENEDLRKENEALHQELNRLGRLARQEERVPRRPAGTNTAQPIQELLRLRGEVGVLRQESQDAKSLREQNRLLEEALEKATALPSSAPTALFWSRESLASAGRDSPESALKSFLWALTQGDLRSARAGATGPELEHIDTWIASGEGEASAQIKTELGALQSVVVRRRDVLADGAVLLTVLINEGTERPNQQLEPGSFERGSKFWMKKIDSEWKVSDFP